MPLRPFSTTCLVASNYSVQIASKLLAVVPSSAMQTNRVWMLTGHGFILENLKTCDKNFKILSNHTFCSEIKKRLFTFVTFVSVARQPCRSVINFHTKWPGVVFYRSTVGTKERGLCDFTYRKQYQAEHWHFDTWNCNISCRKKKRESFTMQKCGCCLLLGVFLCSVCHKFRLIL